MAFGIPGDAVTAVMLGAMTIHGIQSGPLFVSQNPDVAYGIYAAYILAHPLMLLIIGVQHAASCCASPRCGSRCWRRSCWCCA